MPIAAPPDDLAKWFEMLSWLAALILAGIGLWQLKASLAQRREEQTWRRVEAAAKLVAEMIDDEDYCRAALVLDVLPSKVTFRDRHIIKVTAEKIRKALSSPEPAGDHAQICFSFDGLFWHMAKYEHFISRELVDFEDVAFPISYYVELLIPYREEVRGYLDRNHMTQAKAFLARCKFWTS